MKEIFLFDAAETIVPTYDVSMSDFQSQYFPLGKESKNYFRSYVQEALNRGIKVKSFTFWFAGPLVSIEAIKFSIYWNRVIKQIGGIQVEIKVLSLEQLINYIISNIPTKKWYVLNQHPSVCMSRAQVEALIEAQLAILV